MVCRYVFLSFQGRLTDLRFVAGLEHLTAAWVAFVEQLRKEVAISVFVEDQFALGRCGVGLCVLDFEKSGCGAVRARDFRDFQIRAVQYVDAVLTSRKSCVSGVELKWDVDV